MARQVRKLTFSEADKKRIAGSKSSDSLTGRAIHEIGKGLADVELPKKKTPVPTENKTKPDGLAKLQENFKPPVIPIDPIQPLETGITWGDIKITENPPRPAPAITNPPAKQPNKTNPYTEGPALPIGWLEAPPTQQPTLPDLATTPTDTAGGEWAGDNFGGLSTLDVTGGTRGRTRAKAERVHGRNKPPTQRNSPLKRDVSSFGLGDQGVGHDLQRTGADKAFGVGTGESFAQGYNAAIDRHNYKRKVWQDLQKEADESFGKLEVEPSGVSSYDAAVTNMAKEWQDEMFELLNNKDQYDPYEYTQKVKEIEGRAKQYNQAATNIQQVVADFAENKDQISASTDPDVVDLLNTLEKGGDGVSVANVNGVPTLTGTTLQGKNISVPLSEIAQGRGSFRFNKQEDVQGQFDTITQNLGKIRTQIAQNWGLTTQSVGWDKLRPNAERQLDGMLKNDHQVRSVLADQYGYDFDQYEEMFGGDLDKARDFAKQLMLEDLEGQLTPYLASQSHQADPRVAAQQRQQRLDIAQSKEDRIAQGDAGTPEATFKNALKTKNFGDINNKLEGQGLKLVWHKGKLLVGKKNAEGKYDEITMGPEEIIDLLEKSGAKPPTKRKSPLKRFTDWMGMTK